MPVPRFPATVAAVLLLLALARPAASDVPLGEPWESGILEGIDRQERDRQQRSADHLLRQARLAAARRSDPVTTVVRLYLLGRAYGIAGDTGSARATYREVLGLAPRCYFVYHDLAMLDLGRQPPDERSAEQNLRRAVQIHHGFTTGHRKLALTLQRAGRHAEAVEAYRRVIEQDPKDAQARSLLCHSLFEAGRLAECQRELEVLRRLDPRQPSLTWLEASVLRKQGRLDEALTLFRRLAIENPARQEPLIDVLQCLDERRRQTEEVDVDAYLWALEGLYRLERDPERREQLKKGIEEMRTWEERRRVPAEPGAPPSEADLLRVLGSPQVEARLAALRYVYAREEAPSEDLVRATVKRLSPVAEPEAEVRAWALRVIGRFGSPRLAGLVRHSLKDPAGQVRVLAVDTLVDLGRASPPARRTALLVLGPEATGRDAALASAARAAVRDLVQAAYPDPATEDEAGQVAAFAAWWAGPVAGELKTQALEGFLEARDLAPDEVLVAYLSDPDGHVVAAAWKALAQLARSAGGDARGAWLARLPAYDAEALADGRLEETRRRLLAWAAARP